VIVSTLAFAATTLSAWSAFASFRLNNQTQQTVLFTQLLQQYRAIASQFPNRILDPDFHPAVGSDDYWKILQFWQYAYVEWFATNKLNPALYNKLWDSYYSHRIVNALAVPSLRAVLIDQMRLVSVADRDTAEFYDALRKLARDDGSPLVDDQHGTPLPKAP
jgi:hypothetical protein